MHPLTIRIGIFALVAFTTVGGGNEPPRHGRYVGKIDNDGVISFVVSRNLKRVSTFRCRFSATDSQHRPSSLTPETFTVSFSSRRKDFPLGVSPRYGFNAFGKDRVADTHYFVYGDWKRRGLIKGHVQYQKWFQSTYLNPSSGEVETVRIPLGFDGLHYFTARVRRQR